MREDPQSTQPEEQPKDESPGSTKLAFLGVLFLIITTITLTCITLKPAKPKWVGHAATWVRAKHVQYFHPNQNKRNANLSRLIKAVHDHITRIDKNDVYLNSLCQELKRKIEALNLEVTQKKDPNESIQ